MKSGSLLCMCVKMYMYDTFIQRLQAGSSRNDLKETTLRLRNIMIVFSNRKASLK